MIPMLKKAKLSVLRHLKTQPDSSRIKYVFVQCIKPILAIDWIAEQVRLHESEMEHYK